MKKYAKLAMMESMRRGREARSRDYDPRQETYRPTNRTRYYTPYDRMDDDQPEGRVSYGGFDGRFRDRRGTERYDDGRYAPRNRRGRMNVIGFDRDGDEFRNNRIGYEISNNHSDTKRGKREHGYASGTEEAEFSEAIARRWVQSMEREDGMRGEKWSIDEVRDLMNQNGINEEPYKVWAAMNADYADRCRVNERYGITSKEYYLESAIAFWFRDRDAVRDKLGAYYECIVKQ